MARAGTTLAMGASEAVAGRFVQAPFGHALIEVARARPEVLGLTADLGKYTDIQPFAEAFPDRFFNVGMAEQNLIAVAAGLAKCGKIPYCTTFGVFATRRAYDFIAIACAHSNLPVKIFAALPGLTTGYGATHQAFEDAMLMRAIPNMTVIDPCDATEIMQATHAAAEIEGTVYVRIQRGNVPVVLDPAGYRFAPGKAKRLRNGKDVGVIATGLMTARALAAAERLAPDGLGVAVLHVPTLKPFDAETVATFAASVPRLVTAENHVASGGLASLVVEALYERGIHRPLRRVGLPDRFPECGSVPHLQEKYGLSVEGVARAIKEN